MNIKLTKWQFKIIIYTTPKIKYGNDNGINKLVRIEMYIL